MKGSEGIPALKLATLNKLITKFDKAPDLFFSSMFPSNTYESDTIKWEIEYGSAGITPFVAPGSPAPTVGVDGTGEASAKAAYFKEKMFFDEEFLNNMRQPGSYQKYDGALRKLSRGMRKLDYRIQRRREWMFAKMFTEGGFSYHIKGGAKFTINYGIPSNHVYNVANSWGTDDANVVGDIFDAKIMLSEDAGAKTDYAVCNSSVLRVMLTDTSTNGIQNLLKKSNFGEGDLFARPSEVIGTLLGIGTLKVYDEYYDLPGTLLQDVSAGETTIYIDDVADYEVGGKLRFHNLREYNDWEDTTISAVNVEAGTVTLATGPTSTYKAKTSKVTMRKKFISDGKLHLGSDKFEGQSIAEFLEAPYGVQRRWGKFADTKDEWDPDGVWIRFQDKGLPVMYFPETSITMDVIL